MCKHKVLSIDKWAHTKIRKQLPEISEKAREALEFSFCQEAVVIEAAGALFHSLYFLPNIYCTNNSNSSLSLLSASLAPIKLLYTNFLIG